MLLIEVQQYNLNCKQEKTRCQCLSIVSSGTKQRLSIPSTTISRQYIQCKRKRKKNNKANFQQQKNYKLLTDKMSFYSGNNDKGHQAENQSKVKLQKNKVFLSFINQSFSIFFNYLPNYRALYASHMSRLIYNKFRKKIKFRFKLLQMICLIIFGCMNYATAKENVSSLKSSKPFGSIRAFESVSSNNLSNSDPNSSTTYSPPIDLIKNLLPSTKSSNNFYRGFSNYSIHKTTTILSNEAKSLNFSSKISNSLSRNLTNKIKSAHKNTRERSNALKSKFNQINLNSSIDNNKVSLKNEWPYGFKINEKNDDHEFNWTNNSDEQVTNKKSNDWLKIVATESVQKISPHEFDSRFPLLTSEYDPSFSSNMTPTSSALVSKNQSLKSPQNTDDTYKFNPENLDNSTVLNNEDFFDNLNITDSTNFMDDFLQPFTNISWWFKIPFPKSGYHNYSIVFLAFFITIVMMLVVIGNLLVCIAICTEKSLKTIQNWFIASLAVSDLLLGLIIMPFSLAYELIGTWIFSDLWCDFHHALDVLLTTASINNLCLISLDRYWSVTQAIEYLKKRTPCRAIFMIVFAWVFSAVVCLPPLIGWKKDNQEPGECQLSNDLGYVVYSSLGSFYIPSIVMIFVYAKIFIAARSRARKHVRKKQQISGASGTLEQKSSLQMTKQISPQPPASTSSQDNALYNRPVTTSASSIQQLQKQNKEESNEKELSKSESKGSIKVGRVPLGRFTRQAQLGINNEQEIEESETVDANQHKQVEHEQNSINLHTVVNQTTVTESSSVIDTGEERQMNSAPTSGSSAQTEPAEAKTIDEKIPHFPCARSTSAFTYDHLFVEDKKSIPSSSGEKSDSVGRPSTPSSKVTFSPNDIVFNLNANNTQSISMVPQIVIHGSMQQLHLQQSIKRTRFCPNKIKDSDFNNNNNQSEKKFGHTTITGTLSAGQLDCVILDKAGLKQLHNTPPIDGQPKRSSIKRSKFKNELEIDCTAAQQLNQPQTVGSPHSILKQNSNSSPTALAKSTNLESQIELQEQITAPRNSHQSLKEIESNISNLTNNLQRDETQKSPSNHVSPISRTFSEQTANSAKNAQEGKLNYLGVTSLQSAASISGSTMSINYEYDSEYYMDEKSSRRGFEEDEFEFDDENESSNTHDENASKRSLKSNLRQSKKVNIFTKWPWCKKWLWLNEKCYSNQEEEFAGYEEDDEEEDEEFEDLGKGKSSGDHLSKKGTGKRILRKNKNKSYNASIISANNTSSSGTHNSASAQSGERKSAEKKRSSLFSRFSRDNSNKSTSSGSAKRNDSAAKQRSSAKSSCSVAAISQSSRQRKHRHKTGSQLHAHSSSTTAHSESGGQYRFHASEADRHKRRIAKAREKRATLILGLIMAAFILGYIPFSTMYLIQGICPDCQIQSALTITYWIGYTASAINPIIYTVFNRDFRRSFRKILFR